MHEAGRMSNRGDDAVVLARRHLSGEDFSGRRLTQFSAEGARLERCRFDGTVIEFGSFGAGRVVSEYLDCTFEGATIHMGPGGYARFVDCTFLGTRIENWFCFAVEIVGCTFSGRLEKVVFNGTVPPDDRDVVGRATNAFENNDFSDAKLVDTAFRTGIDLTRQRLPTGHGYTYLADARSAVHKAKGALSHWDDAQAKKRASAVLAVMEEDVEAGQNQLLMRAEDYPRAYRAAVEALFRAASA